MLLLANAFIKSYFNRYFQLQRYFRHIRNRKLNILTQIPDNNFIELNVPHANVPNFDNRSANLTDLNMHINQIGKEIDVELGIIKSRNQISASKI